VSLHVSGMTCGGCVKSVERIIRKADPAAEVRVDLASGHVEAQSVIAADVLAAAVTKGGFEARVA
jgi:copper chaperone